MTFNSALPSEPVVAIGARAGNAAKAVAASTQSHPQVMTDARYALYFAPPAADPLWSFGSTAIGYDAETRAEVAIPPVDGFSADALLAATAEPRIYGFHATLKAPFHLIEGADEAGFLSAVRAFAANVAPFEIPRLAVNAIGAFIALTPAEPCEPLQALAKHTVTILDAFRATLDPADRERRLKSPLTDRQIEQLDRWGYPYVLDDFKFHMTLSGKLDDATRDRLAAAYATRYAAIDRPVTVGEIAVFMQPDRKSRFRVVERVKLGR